jgi:hypothetical protein
MSLVFPNTDPPTPLSARLVCIPCLCGGGRTHSPGGEGGGGSIFWKTRDIGLPSYSNNLSTTGPDSPTILQNAWRSMGGAGSGGCLGGGGGG